MIKPGDIIKHKNFKDVAVLITFKEEHPETGEMVLKGTWINQGQKTSFVINSKKHPTGIPTVLNLRKKDLEDWLICSKPESSFIRGEEWLKLK